jgi:iron complex outermembrane recepter protein
MKTPKHSALALAAAAALALPAAAQQAAAPAKTDKPVEQITVTGSRIRGIEPIGSPVVGVGRADIESSNVASTALMLQQVPQVFNLGVSESSRGQSGGSGNITYSSGINLRGIGPFATLVLVNGHRVVGQGTTAAAVDPSIIPMLMLERVEIVADGASAIYGSDAVAGVANLILRRNEKTVQGYVRLGRADSYAERQLGALWATRWATGQATVGFEHSYRDALSGRDRDFFSGDLRAQGGGDFRASQCAPGNIVIAGTNYAIPAGGVTSANAASLVAGTTNRCDNLKVQDLIPRQERNGLGFTFNQDFAGGISTYADGFFTERRYRFRPAALSSNLTVPSTNPFYVRPPGAPAGANETVAYSFIDDLPVNTANGFSRTYQVTAGADVALGKDWKVGALVGVGYNDDLSVTRNALTTGAITAALADTNPATALNVFGGANNPATLAKLAQNQSYSPGTTNFHNFQLKADGSLFALPGGPGLRVPAVAAVRRPDRRHGGGADHRHGQAGTPRQFRLPGSGGAAGGREERHAGPAEAGHHRRGALRPVQRRGRHHQPQGRPDLAAGERLPGARQLRRVIPRAGPDADPRLHQRRPRRPLRAELLRPDDRWRAARGRHAVGRQP